MARDRGYPKQRKKIECSRWVFSDGSWVEHYDFVKLTKRNPPDIDADPIILEFPVNRISSVLMRLRE